MNSYTYPAGATCDKTYYSSYDDDKCRTPSSGASELDDVDTGLINDKGECSSIYACDNGTLKTTSTRKMLYNYDATVDNPEEWDHAQTGTRSTWNYPSTSTYMYCYPPEDETNSNICVQCGEGDDKAVRIVHRGATKDTKESFECKKMRASEMCFKDGKWGLVTSSGTCDPSLFKEGASCYVDKEGEMMKGTIPVGANQTTGSKVPCSDLKPVSPSSDDTDDMDQGWPSWVRWGVLLLLLLCVGALIYAIVHRMNRKTISTSDVTQAVMDALEQEM